MRVVTVLPETTNYKRDCSSSSWYLPNGQHVHKPHTNSGHYFDSNKWPTIINGIKQSTSVHFHPVQLVLGRALVAAAAMVTVTSSRKSLSNL